MPWSNLSLHGQYLAFFFYPSYCCNASQTRATNNKHLLPEAMQSPIATGLADLVQLPRSMPNVGRQQRLPSSQDISWGPCNTLYKVLVVLVVLRRTANNSQAGFVVLING